MSGAFKVSASTVMELCKLYDSDEQIADILQCSVTIVKAYRALATPKKSKTQQKRDQRKRAIENEPRLFVSKLQSEAEKMAECSRRLLVRQLETGQHALDRARFKDVVTSLGLADRLPPSLRV